jgi:DNA-binding response OmpR family regulator
VRIAILEDDLDLAELVGGWLKQAHHEVEVFESGAALLNAVALKRYDLMVLDWMLPGLSGLEVVTRLRASGSRVPVLFLTQFDSVDNVATALKAGADDYLAKPVSRNLFLTRVQGLLGAQGGGEAPKDHSVGRYRTDSAAKTIMIDERAVALTAGEFALAWQLFANFGRLVTRSDLRRVAWQSERDGKQNTHGMDFELSLIKLKLALDGSHGLALTRVHNLGYRLEHASGVERPPSA